MRDKPRYITMSQLGSHGRAANTMFEYAFLRIYAEQHGLQLQTAPWFGQHLFGHRDPPITQRLPRYEEKTTGPSGLQGVPPEAQQVVNHDWLGYGQYHTSYYSPHSVFFRSLFYPRAQIAEGLQGPLGTLACKGRTRIGVHLRRGDYGRSIFYMTPVSWYLDFLRSIWREFNSPVLFVASEDRKLVREFEEFDPEIAESLGVEFATEEMPEYNYLPRDLEAREPWQLDWYPDFYLLSQCHILIIPNSTFSFVAAMLNPHLRALYRSHLPTQEFRQIDPWDTYPLEHDRAEDYKQIPGVCL